jgi:hypothetical protein
MLSILDFALTFGCAGRPSSARSVCSFRYRARIDSAKPCFAGAAQLRTPRMLYAEAADRNLGFRLLSRYQSLRSSSSESHTGLPLHFSVRPSSNSHFLSCMLRLRMFRRVPRTAQRSTMPQNIIQSRRPAHLQLVSFSGMMFVQGTSLQRTSGKITSHFPYFPCFPCFPTTSPKRYMQIT